MAGASSTTIWEADVAEREENIIIPEDGKRPSVDPPLRRHKLMPWDKVYLQRAGGTIDRTIYYAGEPKDGKYPLWDKDGNILFGKELFEEWELIDVKRKY
ncbi:hypothetical protein AA313_de0206280 [Arthrobotrys entomopaga]|nr:hypothetical protein AA313_de0206280 [Arthrobotrys entomopaga]